MKKLLFFICVLGLSGLFSCSPDFYCKRCPIKIHDTVITTVKDTTILRDTIIKVEADTLILIDSVPCKDFVKEVSNARTKIKIQVKDNLLTASCICKALELKAQLRDHYHSESTLHSRVEVRQVKAPKTGFQRFKDWFFWIVCVVVIISILRRILIYYHKLPFKL